MICDRIRAEIHCERRGTGPCAADPALPSDLRSVFVQPLQSMPALGDECTHRQQRLSILGLEAGNPSHAGRRRVIRHPAAGLVRSLPCRLAGIIDTELIVQPERLMPEASHLILPRLNRTRGDMVNAMPSSFGITQQIIAAIPPCDIFTRGKRSLAHQISHAVISHVFDDERDHSGFRQRELDRDGWRFLGLFRQDERSQCRIVGKRREHDDFTKPDPFSLPYLPGEMRVHALRRL